jgi:hypothetical protein
MDKRVFKKVTGLVHIRASRQLTLIERKVSNVLLANAYTDLNNKRIFEISIEKLMSSVGWDSKKDITYFKKVLENLAQTLLEFNVFGKDKKAGSWEIMNLLASAKIRDGVCRYSYSVPLIEKILDSGIYAKLDIEICKQFKNRDAHSLWEFLVECLSSRNGNGTVATPWITIEEFICKILNKKNKKISFKKINYQYIKKSIQEINKLSNIRVVDTEIEKKKDGVYVRFLIEWADVNSPVMDLVDDDKARVESMIRQYSEIKATKSPIAYANVVKKSLANGETTMDVIEEFLNKYNVQKQKKESVLDSQCDELYDQKELLKKWDKLSESEQKKLENQAIDELKRSGLKNIERDSIANKSLIREKILDFLQSEIVKGAI